MSSEAQLQKKKKKNSWAGASARFLFAFFSPLSFSILTLAVSFQAQPLMQIDAFRHCCELMLIHLQHQVNPIYLLSRLHKQSIMDTFICTDALGLFNSRREALLLP
jgi:hypothetical protein